MIFEKFEDNQFEKCILLDILTFQLLIFINLWIFNYLIFVNRKVVNNIYIYILVS